MNKDVEDFTKDAVVGTGIGVAAGLAIPGQTAAKTITGGHGLGMHVGNAAGSALRNGSGLAGSVVAGGAALKGATLATGAAVAAAAPAILAASAVVGVAVGGYCLIRKLRK